jgi:hypothetical protein
MEGAPVSSGQEVRYWWPDQTGDELTAARTAVQTEAINHLNTIGLHLKPPTQGGDSFKVVQLQDSESYKEQLFQDDPKEKNIHFTQDEGSRGYIIGCFDPGTELEVVAAKADGTLSSSSLRPKKLPANPTAESLTKFTVGDAYAGAGYFNDPDEHHPREKTGPARMFLAPLSGLAITVVFHPDKTENCLGNTRRFASIIHYRVDGLFSTSHSTSWQACDRLEHLFPRLFPSVFLADWPTFLPDAQTLKSWRQTVAIDAGHKHDGEDAEIPDNQVMKLYPVSLNSGVLDAFLQSVPEAWRKHAIFTPDRGEWIKSSCFQASLSFAHLMWETAEKYKGEAGGREFGAWMAHLSEPVSASEVFLGHVVCKRNVDLSWKCMDTGKPMSLHSEDVLTDEDWKQAYQSETIDMSKNADLNWDKLVGTLKARAEEEAKAAKRRVVEEKRAAKDRAAEAARAQKEEAKKNIHLRARARRTPRRRPRRNRKREVTMARNTSRIGAWERSTRRTRTPTTRGWVRCFSASSAT